MKSLGELMDGVEACDFECQAGPLGNNQDWLHLRGAVLALMGYTRAPSSPGQDAGMREALEYYADPKTWEVVALGGGEYEREVDDDCGCRARHALTAAPSTAQDGVREAAVAVAEAAEKMRGHLAPPHPPAVYFKDESEVIALCEALDRYAALSAPAPAPVCKTCGDTKRDKTHLVMCSMPGGKCVGTGRNPCRGHYADCPDCTADKEGL